MSVNVLFYIDEATFSYAGNLSKLLEVSTDENILLTTYGKLQPPLGKHRLKVSLPFTTLINHYL